MLTHSATRRRTSGRQAPGSGSQTTCGERDRLPVAGFRPASQAMKVALAFVLLASGIESMGCINGYDLPPVIPRFPVTKITRPPPAGPQLARTPTEVAREAEPGVSFTPPAVSIPVPDGLDLP